MITKKENERITSQKNIIFDYLKSVKTHPTAQEIYAVVRKKLPRISLGTVYRVLNNLKEKDKIQEILWDVAHFDGDTLPHAHFFCEKCKRIFDIFEECEILKKRKSKVGKIKNYQIYFYGFCKNCQRK